MPAPIAVAGLGTALPDYRVLQEVGCEWLTNRFGYPPRLRRFAERIFRLSRVEARYSVLPDFTDPGDAVLYGSTLPSLEARMRLFSLEAPKLAFRACREAIAEARVTPEALTHLVVVTSTGFFTPGPDVVLVDLLGLSPSIERTVVSMSGCAGAFCGLRVAGHIAAADSRARVLLVCVELSSIHLDDQPSHEKIVAYSIFGDSAAAAVVGAVSSVEAPVAVVDQFETRLLPEGRDLLRWDIRSTGFAITLGSGLVAFLAEHLKEFISPKIRAVSGGCDDPTRVPSWVVHPGGPAVLEGVQRALGLDRRNLTSAWETLRDGGNLSSASVLFVMQRERSRCQPGTRGVLLGFGPGLTLESAAYSLGGFGHH